ncbi:aminopeptidase [Latilactobacillus fuchuensis]|uniref:Aminopeptidase n=1 Tax=Latilactobacillus fuchuensis DSM 14340 = JCM 11249 TaxID=1423747 RepID=A0A0R1S5R4_9LACO|nr:aminopeptidase [Latilactobacillus fuchuensis]KRL61651.1 aminopeptidase [Latilactobacillus fuchuensis DSM 14340 = JCM 11249]
MDFELLRQLSNADAIASNENEVRELLKHELVQYQETFQFDGLGSLMVTKKSQQKDAPTIMFAAHMDEVGFMIRYISDIGMAYLTTVGGVENRAKSMQLVRATTRSGDKIEGLLNVKKDSHGEIQQMYVDFGFDSRTELIASGLDIGNMVCFASDCRALAPSEIVAGKAMDDRAGCFALVQAMKDLVDIELAVNVVAAFTSSEEVGTRGGRLTTQIINPDIFFAIDVAKNPELDRSFMNTRKLGAGPMVEFYDKTMVPNPKLIRLVCDVADEESLSYQKDMFKGGGTDAGTAHLEHGGIPACVLGLPLRYCHDPYSLVNKNDLMNMNKLIQTLSKSISSDVIAETNNY